RATNSRKTRNDSGAPKEPRGFVWSLLATTPSLAIQRTHQRPREESLESHCLEGSPFSSKRAGRAGSGTGLRFLRAPTPEQGYCLAKSSRSLEIGLGKAPAFGASCMSL